MSGDSMMNCLASWLGSLRRWGFGDERSIYAALVKFMNDLSALIERGEKNCSSIQLTERQRKVVRSYEYVQIWCKPSVRVLTETHMSLYQRAHLIKAVRQILHEWIFNGDGKNIDFEIRPLDPYCNDDDFCVVDDSSDETTDDDTISEEDSEDSSSHDDETNEQKDERSEDDSAHKEEKNEKEDDSVVDDDASFDAKFDDDNTALAECRNENSRP